MISLSPAAAHQLAELTRYYSERGREVAIDRLVDHIDAASARVLSGQGLFYDAPRPYPTLLRPGWRWTKEGRYWVAFNATEQGFFIRAIFYDAANLPGRLQEG